MALVYGLKLTRFEYRVRNWLVVCIRTEKYLFSVCMSMGLVLVREIEIDLLCLCRGIEHGFVSQCCASLSYEVPGTQYRNFSQAKHLK